VRWDVIISWDLKYQGINRPRRGRNMIIFYVEHNQTQQTHNIDNIVNEAVRWQVFRMQGEPVGKIKEMITEQYIWHKKVVK
jgi:hypothetical protein